MKSRGLVLLALALAPLQACSRATQERPGKLDAAAGASGSGVGDGQASGPGLAPNLGEPEPSGILRIEPAQAVVEVISGEPLPQLAFQAWLDGVRAEAEWSFDRAELGSVDDDGVLSPSGVVAGVGRLSARYGERSATATVTIQLRTTELGDPEWTATPASPGPGGFRGVGGDGAGAPPSNELRATLDSAPSYDASVSLLYPYDRTVFPQGLLAPLLQWHPGEHVFDGVRVQVKGENYDYTGYFAANHAPFRNLPLPQAAWEAMTHSSGGKSLAVSLVFAEGGKALGPYAVSWTIAPAVLRGTIYYHSYGTSLVTNSPYPDAYGEQFGAATLAIRPGASSPTLTAGVESGLDGDGCRVCHTVAGAGHFMVTQGNRSMGNDYSDTVAIDLTNDTTAGAGDALRGAPSLAFPALSRDGSLLFSSSGGMEAGDSSSRLYAMPAATLVSGVSGLPADFRATLPAFSPDTRHLSFNLWDGELAGQGITADRASLVVLDFDGHGAFSNPRVVFTPATGGWPETGVTFSSFLPDSSGLVFALQLGNQSQFWGYTWGENTSELWWVELATKQPRRLDALNGWREDGAPYLPDDPDRSGRHPAARDAIVNYEPTVSPIPAGGYAWVVFTSRRLYGNVATAFPWRSDPRNYPWRDEVTPKKLWVAAIDLGAEPGTDPSHPAFYLPAQELYAGNSRGFWSFEPCRADGSDCESGDQCCGGFCQRSPGGGSRCGSDAPACSALLDRCEAAADCCDADDGRTACINRVCTAPRPPK